VLQPPIIVLLDEDRADEADDRGLLGKIPTTSARRFTSLFRRSAPRSCGAAPIPVIKLRAVARSLVARALIS
jgi:hypothetical protein